MITHVILDLDGVIYRGNKLIEGADKAIVELKKRGIKITYLTNACTKSRKGRVEKLRRLGIEATEEEVFTTSYAVAKYIAENYPRSKQNVFYIGGEGVGEELSKQNIRIVDATKAHIVVVGLDTGLSYEKMTMGFRAIMRGADFIATNADPTFPVEDGLLPGAGALVGFLVAATGKKPLVIGKPHTYMLEMVLRASGSNKSEMLIVGDRIETDIAMGKKFGVKTALVLSGVTKKEELKNVKKKDLPDYTINSIADLPSILP
jgi:HAD superfamily hydrolase (TIGR01457 family)